MALKDGGGSLGGEEGRSSQKPLYLGHTLEDGKGTHRRPSSAQSCKTVILGAGAVTHKPGNNLHPECTDILRDTHTRSPEAS